MADSDLTTLYLRGVPRAVVREAKAAAAREGLTLGRWVSTRLAEATGSAHCGHAGADLLQADMAWFEEHEPSLARRYVGQYVAIVQKKVIDHDKDFDALARRVFSKYGAGPVCMPKVGRGEVHLRSPRRAGR